MKYTARRDELPRLIENLRSLRYTVIGPTVSDGVVRLGELREARDLASGVIDHQAPGTYAIGGLSSFIFSSAVGPDSPKEYLHPSEVEMLRLKENGDGFEVVPSSGSDKKHAFIGIRPCDLKAVQVMDRTMLVPGWEDSVYAKRRKDSIFVVVNCTRAGENCFCASMGTGPGADSGYDIAITELPDKLLLDVPDGGSGLLHGMDLTPSTEEELRRGREMVSQASEQMRKRIDRENPSGLMYDGMESPVWVEVADRCLACANCTMVCPTCFCNAVQDRTDLRDGTVARVRMWDSCLSKDFTHSSGGNPRQERKARYRQFVMHKFAYWLDQSGVYGCVGCGRCITWCPVGIDITETVNGVIRRPVAEAEKAEGQLHG